MGPRKRYEFHEEDFTLQLAIVDAIPVSFFLGSMITVSTMFGSLMFLIGATCSLVAGFSKVLWKLIMGLGRGNKAWLSNLFVPFQSIGFMLMIASLIFDRDLIVPGAVWKTLTGMPSALFFFIGTLGMILMIIMSVRFNQSIKSHWRAQIVNTIAQAAIFFGLLIIR